MSDRQYLILSTSEAGAPFIYAPAAGLLNFDEARRNLRKRIQVSLAVGADVEPLWLAVVGLDSNPLSIDAGAAEWLFDPGAEERVLEMVVS